MRTEWIDDKQLELVLALLMPQNRLIMQLCIHTGLRVGDVVALRTEQLKPRVYVREHKTGKSRRVTIPAKLLRSIQEQAGNEWAFP
ncbi:MAG: tyrosine-type recombinase/integrase, partial [Candidatus Limivicinus sp.]